MVEMMNYKVCVVTGTRADFGVLKELLLLLKDSSLIDLKLVVTGSHLSDKFGNTVTEIVESGFKEFYKLPILVNDDSKNGMVKSTSVALASFGDFFVKETPNLLVVLGDRYEIFAAAVAAHMIGIPIAHISGGDVTEGAIDDAIRHSITKMSYLHFPGCEQSRSRIIQMGEDPARVFNVGEPGVENCLKTNFLSRIQLADELNFMGIKKDYCVVTFHPVTLEDNTALGQVKNLIHAMDAFPEMNYIITMANADAGGRSINTMWIEEGKKRDNWLVAYSLGTVRYLSALRYAKLVLGNSSSGIIEAPAMGIPTVNIGNRQKGRMIADSVISCDSTIKEIVGAMRKALSEEFQQQAKYVESPFGDGNTSSKIYEKIVEFLSKRKDDFQKSFYDMC